MYIKGKTTTDNSTYSGFLEPKLSMLESGLLIESGLCLTTNKQIPVNVINFSDHPVQVYEYKVLGKLYPIDNRCDDSYRSIKISDDKPAGVINDMHVNSKPTIQSEKWTQERVWTELQLNEIPDITEHESTELKDLFWKFHRCFS